MLFRSVDLIEAGYGAQGLVRKVYGGVDQQLLGKLDNSSVRATDVPARAALRA